MRNRRDHRPRRYQQSAACRAGLCPSLADRDPTVFTQPTVAEFDRPSTPGHLAFGAGPHRCLGASIATEAFTSALTEWHHLIPGYAPASHHTKPRTGGGAVCSLDALPLTWPALPFSCSSPVTSQERSVTPVYVA